MARASDASESGGVVLSVFQRRVRLGYVQRLLRLGLTGWNIDTGDVCRSGPWADTGTPRSGG